MTRNGQDLIRVLLLDAGGVLFSNVIEESGFLAILARRYDVQVAGLAARIEMRDSEYETGERHVHDVLRDCVAEAGGRNLSDWDPDWLDQLYLACVQAHHETFGALVALRRQRPALLVALANNEAAHWESLRDRRFGHLRLFDIIGSSWRVGAVKPRADYFSRVLGACGCAPSEAVLLDDNPEVIAAAAAFGLGTRLVSHPLQASAALSTLARAG